MDHDRRRRAEGCHLSSRPTAMHHGSCRPCGAPIIAHPCITRICRGLVTFHFKNFHHGANHCLWSSYSLQKDCFSWLTLSAGPQLLTSTAVRKHYLSVLCLYCMHFTQPGLSGRSSSTFAIAKYVYVLRQEDAQSKLFRASLKCQLR